MIGRRLTRSSISHIQGCHQLRVTSVGVCSTSKHVRLPNDGASINVETLKSLPPALESSQGFVNMFGKLNLNHGQTPTPWNVRLSRTSLLSSIERSRIESPHTRKTPILDHIQNLEHGIGDLFPERNGVVQMPSRCVIEQDSVIGDIAPVVRKEGRMIQKIRRRKMNRHWLKKLRKKMLFYNRKMRLRREKRKEKILQDELSVIRLEAEDFDARQFVLKELEEARRGGFKIDIWNSWQKQKQSQ